jgi:nucleotide-binding universal stress UspA family protein
VTDVEERPIVGAPIYVPVKLVDEVNADLLVVGNVGLNSIAGRLLGSVPREVRRRAKPRCWSPSPKTEIRQAVLTATDT